MKGFVTLLGAGPGDKGLLTVKGVEALERADIVIYDFLADPAFLKLAGSATEKIYVGKSGPRHTMEQPEINELMERQARQGKQVVRLKGGDPYIFGRGGEEAEYLAKNGIPFSVIPGIPSALGAAAYAGIPLTDRKAASSVTFVTGHEDPAKDKSAIDWKALAETNGTLVVYMGMKNISRISALLIKNGRLPETPAAVVQWATKPNQRTVRGTLDTIADIVEKERLEHPALIIIGDVVGLRQGLNWFEKLPMFGKTIAVTRAADQARSLAEMLNNHGAHVVETPAIRMEPPEDWTEVDRAIEDLPGYRWVVFTSVNGVHAFCERLMARGHDARHFGRCRIAAIGSATADALSRCGLRADFVPGKYTSAALAEGLKDTAGQKVLLARADIGTPALNSALEEKGARVTDVAVYRTLPAEFDAGELETLLSKGKLQGITFTSASTVRSILAKAGPSLLKAGNCALFSIGPETSAALGEAGLAPAREAVEHTIPGLVAAILEYFRDPEEGSHD